MRVEFTFSNAGRTFTVFRRMYWGKKGDSKLMSRESVLSENGSTICFGKGREDRDDVTAKVTQILGLDADQFRRIIMLAQGEFQRFLTAKSDERGVILGKLYDNRMHQDFQVRLKAAAALLKEKDRASVEEVKARLHMFVIADAEEETGANAEGVSEEETGENADEALMQDCAALSPDHPDLLPAMQRIIGRMHERLDRIKKSAGKKEDHLRKLEAQEVRGRTCNALLDDLAGKRGQLEELEEKRGTVDGWRVLAELAQKAQKVQPFETAMLKADEDWNLILKRIAELEKKEALLKERSLALQETSEAVRKKNLPAIEELNRKSGAIRSVLHFYDDLAGSIAERELKEKALEKAGGNENAAGENLKRWEARKKELADMLAGLEGAGEMAVSIAKQKLEELAKQKAALEEIAELTESVRKLEKEESQLAAVLAKARKKEVAAEEDHLRLNKAFIQGQAGILAQDMREKLKTQGEVACPVCGVRHTREDIGHFAAWHEDIPTRDAVDEAYALWETARRAAENAENRRSAKANELLTRQQTLDLLVRQQEPAFAKQWQAYTAEAEAVSESSLVLEAADTVPGTSRESSGSAASLQAGSAAHLHTDRTAFLYNSRTALLRGAIAACSEKISAAGRTCEKAVKDKEAKEKAAAGKTQADAQAEAARRALDEAVRKHNEAKNAAAVAKTREDNWRQQLKGFPESKEAAGKEIEALDRQTGQLQKQIDDAAEAYAACLRGQAENSGRLKSAYTEREERGKAKKSAGEAFLAQLEKQDFADTEAYRKALSPEGTALGAEALSAWLENRKKRIEAYDRNRSDLAAAISQLIDSTKGMQRVDLTALRAQIGHASGELEKEESIRKDLEATVRTDRGVYEELCAIQKKREKYRRAYAKLAPVADTADGRYAFSRYVLTGFFHNIVEQANVHLETMTDGEYCLVPKETGDGRSNIGLELKVLNTITNLERETASLSGGQLFEASLSLALGLSDVVQMESTSNIQIDSMFIDEGFGSLDGGRLDKSIEVLSHLSAGKRQIGIISHVARLDECLPRKIHVIAGAHGSTVKTETDA